MLYFNFVDILGFLLIDCFQDIYENTSNKQKNPYLVKFVFSIRNISQVLPQATMQKCELNAGYFPNMTYVYIGNKENQCY